MAFDNSYTAVTGATYAASDYNTYTKGNFTAVWVGTTAGDMDYYTSATAKSRIPKGTAFQALRMNSGASAPEFANIFAIHAKAIGTYDPSFQDVTSSSYVDITNATLNIVTTRTCTIVMFALGRMGPDTGGVESVARPMISGTGPASDNGSAKVTSNGVGLYPFSLFFYRTGISAGTITCKIQGKVGSGHAYFGVGTIMLFAIEE